MNFGKFSKFDQKAYTSSTGASRWMVFSKFTAHRSIPRICRKGLLTTALVKSAAPPRVPTPLNGWRFPEAAGAWGHPPGFDGMKAGHPVQLRVRDSIDRDRFYRARW